MKIRKFAGTTEYGVIEMVKDELGLDALILNIKKIQPRGIFSFFRKPTVEITAAYEEKNLLKRARPLSQLDSSSSKLLDIEEEKIKDNISSFNKIINEKKISDQDEKIKELQSKLMETEAMLRKAVSQLSISAHRLENGERKYQNNLLQIFYDALIEQEVLPEIAEELLDDLDLIDEKEEIDISIIVRVVYNKIMNILGESKPLKVSKNNDKANVVFFIGATGVGKTTTIAKLSADFILNQKLDVALITADTYRIAAVEQLKTYAEILGVDVEVVYNSEDLEEYIEVMSDLNDLILIDTAGRSHRNSVNLKDLLELLDIVPQAEKFLVMSLTTKYEDILDIVKTYSDITDFKIIFTKLDETLRYGSILNVCYTTGRNVSYVTMGQNVPEDIEPLRPEKIAKALLGLGEND